MNPIFNLWRDMWREFKIRTIKTPTSEGLPALLVARATRRGLWK